MNKLALASAMLLAGIASASAAPLAYTFADSSGNPYCDGITLRLTGGTYVGTHTGSCEAGDDAGGLSVKLKGTKDRIIDVTTSAVNEDATGVENFVLDLTTLTWSLYLEDTTNGTPYQLINSGELLVGPDTNAVGIHANRGSASPLHRR